MVSPSMSRTPTARPERTSTRSTSRSVSQTPPWSRISCTSASASFAPPPRGTGIPPSCTATAITCVMKPDVGWSGPSPVCSTQGASTPCARSEAKVVSSQPRLDCTASPRKASAPARPSRRTAFAPSASPAGDHSSVPRTPNARSALGKKRSRTPGHSGPSSSVFPSAVRSRNAASPSGNAVAVGSSVFRYSSPRAASSSPSSACAAPPTQSGCQALKTSWRNPGSVSSSVLTAPPNQSLRSSTQTRQSARASSAAHARELTPLPTTTASYSATRELPQLVVGDEPALARSELLDPREQLGPTLLGHVEPELLDLDPDRVEPALLAEHDRPLRGDELRGVRLDGGWVVELRGDRTRLAAEEGLARERLPRREPVAGQLLHARGCLADPVEAESGLDPVEPPQRNGDLAEVRVAGALAHAVDRPVDPGGARAHGRDGRRRGEAEVVVSVEVDGQAVDVLEGCAHEVRDRFRRRDPERIDDGDFLRARLHRGLVHLPVEVRLGSRRVDPEKGRMDAVLVREAHRTCDPLEHLLAGDADRVQLEVGDRRLDHRGPDAELDEELEVGGHGAREAPDLRLEPGAGDQLDGPPVILRHAWESRLDPPDPEPVEQPRDLELLLGREDDADGLLAVAQRRVVQADLAADRVAVVERAGPDQVGHRTTPSGNEESFSTPSLVTRKLSSTRSPPPPAQYTPGSTASTIPCSNSPPPAWWGYGGSWARAPTPWQIGCVGWPP